MYKEFVFFLIVLPLLIYPEPLTGAIRNEYIAKYHGLIILTLAYCFRFIILLRPGIHFKWRNTDKLMLLFCLFSAASWGLSRLFIMPETLILTFCYAIIFVRMSNISIDTVPQKQIADLWLVSLAILMSLGIAQYFSSSQVTATLGNRNFFACFIVAGMPFAALKIYEYFQKKEILQLFVSVLILLGCAFCLYCTRSRGAVLVIVVILILYGGIVQKRKVLYILCITAVLASVMLIPYTRSMIYRELKDDVRPYIWLGTFDLISHNPIVGVGPGLFHIAYPPFRPHDYFLTPKSVDATRHAHNELLEVWAETGSLGLITLIGIFALLGYGIYKYRRAKQLNGVLLALIFSSLSILLHSMIDVNMRFMSTTAVFWMQAGIIAGIVFPAGSEIAVSPKVIKARRLLLILLSILAVWLSYTQIIDSFLTEKTCQKGIDARNAGNWEKAVFWYERGLIHSPDNLSLLYYMAYAQDKLGNTPDALKYYQRIITKAPYYASVQKNIATCYLKIGEYFKSLAHYSTQLMLNPNDPDVYLNMAFCYNKIGRQKEAQLARRSAIKVYVSWAMRTFEEKKFDKTITFCETALSIDPDNISALHYLIASVYRTKNDKALYNQYIQHYKPDNKEVGELNRLMGL